MINDGNSNRQIEFPDGQTHSRVFEYALIAISIVCTIIVLIVVLFTDIGDTFRPTV